MLKLLAIYIIFSSSILYAQERPQTQWKNLLITDSLLNIPRGYYFNNDSTCELTSFAKKDLLGLIKLMSDSDLVIEVHTPFKKTDRLRNRKRLVSIFTFLTVNGVDKNSILGEPAGVDSEPLPPGKTLKRHFVSGDVGFLLVGKNIKK